MESYDNVQKICAKNWTRAFFQVPPVELKRDKQKSMKCKALLWPFFPINKEIDVWDSLISTSQAFIHVQRELLWVRILVYLKKKKAK